MPHRLLTVALALTGLVLSMPAQGQAIDQQPEVPEGVATVVKETLSGEFAKAFEARGEVGQRWAQQNMPGMMERLERRLRAEGFVK